MEYFASLVILLALMQSTLCFSASRQQPEVNGPCTGGINTGQTEEDITQLIDLFKSWVQEMHMAAGNSQVIVRGSQREHISKNMENALRRHPVNLFPDSLTDTANLTFTDILVADYGNLLTVAMVFEEMSRIAANCSSDDREIASFQNVARITNATLCHAAILLRLQNYSKPILASKLPIVFTQCTSDDSERHKDNFKIIDATLNYTPALLNLTSYF